MSDTGDSDDSSIEKQLNCKRRVGLVKSSSSNKINNNNRNKKSKIIMKIEFDDFDDDDNEESDISYSDGENADDDDDNLSNDEVKPSTSNRKRLLQSSDDDSDYSNNSEITRKNVTVRGRNFDKNPIISEEDDENDSLPLSISNIINDDGFNSDSSSNETLEKCPICLLSFRNQEIGTPNICEHKFCALCIEEWSKNVQTCPIDRKDFSTIIVYDKFKNQKREIKVIKQIDEKQQNAINDDITYCEICQQCNREDVMLLCDGCNQGFHIFCLTPPLEQIPNGFWYCDNCFDSDDDSDLADDLNALYEDIRHLGIPETRLRITEVRQPRILRTRQSERIRASIVAQTRSRNSNNSNNEIDLTAPSTSRALLEHSVSADRRRIAQTTTTTARKPTKRKTVSRKRNTIRRKRRKTRKTRSRTYVVEYDVNNYDDKFALKTTKKYIRKRRTKRRIKGRKKSKLSIQAERNFEQGNGKRKKYAAEQMSFKRLNKFERPLNPPQSLSLFGNVNDLEYFSDDNNNFQENEFSGVGGDYGSIAVQTSVRFGNITSIRHRKGIKPNIQPPSTGPADLLSNLLDMQDRFLNATRQDQINAVRIDSDGSINFQENLNQSNQSNLEKKNDNEESVVNSNDINQAPMFPWNNNQRNNNVGQGHRGGGGGSSGNYNNRFNNQSNYRNNSGGGNYRHSTGGMGGLGNNNFRFQNQNNNNNPNFTPNYRDRFNRNNQRNRRNQNQNNSGSNNDNNNNNNLLNRQLNSPTNYNDDNSNQSENLNNMSTMSPQQEQQHSPLPRIITSEEVTNSILALKPSTSSSDTLDNNLNDFNLNRNILNPPPLHVPPLNMPPPVNFTPLHYPPLNQSSLTPSLNHPPPLMGSIIGPRTGSITESIGVTPGSAKGAMPGPNIGPVMIDFSQPPPPPPPLPEPEQESLQNEQQLTNTEKNSTFIGPQPLVPPPWNENLFKLATDYCDDDNDDDCPNFSVYSAESLQVANPTTVQNIHGDKAQEDEFDVDEDLVQLGDDDDIPNSIDNSENRNRIEFKITGPKLYKPDKKVDEKLRENKKTYINKDKTAQTNTITNQEKIKPIYNETESEILEEDKEIEEEITEKENYDECKSNEDSNQNNEITEEGNDDDESSINELTPVTYNDLEKPTNETDTDTTTTTPLTNLKNKKGILELYDDSDWEELNIEREQLKQKIAMENTNFIGPQLEMNQNDEYSNNDNDDLELMDTNKLKDSTTNDEVTDRSYTPCLDEKNDHDDVVQILDNNSPPIIASSSFDKNNEDNEKDESGIEGIETELISDAEMIVGEQGKTCKKKDNKRKNDDKNDEKNNLKKSRRNETFKKVTKNQRERNYRGERTDTVRERLNRHSRSRSHSNDKENKDRDKNRRSRERRNSKNRFRRVKRKEIVRYNVRNIINQPRTYKDRYGRDTSRPPRSRSNSRPIRTSRSRSRSRSYIRSPIRSRSRSRSRSLSSVRKNVRSFTISPTPLSPQGYRGRRPFSPRHVRRFTPVGRRRSHTPLRMRSRSQSRSRSRSNSIADRGTGIGDRRRYPSNNRIRQRSLSVSSKSKSPQAYTPALKRAGSVIKNRKGKRSKKRKTRRSISSPHQTILQHSKRLSRPRERTSPNVISEQVTTGIGVGNRKKKSRRSRSKSPVIDHIEGQNRGWTTSPEYNPNEKKNDVSWTPPIRSPPQHGGFRVMFKEPRKKREKKKTKDKRKERNSGNTRKEKRNKNKDKTPQAPSKEVFASGDNILVSVSFNKDTADTNVPQQQTTVVTLPPTRAEIVSNRRQSSTERQRSRRNKDQSTINQSGSNQQRQRKHRKINIKPVAIIDLDRSPFQVIQVPRDIIVLTDSENENEQRLNTGGVDGGVGSVGRRSSSVGLDNDVQQHQLQQQMQQPEQQHRENSKNRSVETNDDNENDNHHRHHHENGHHRLRKIDDDEDDDEINNNKTPERNDHLDSKLPDDSYAIQQLGPKTPPEPPIIKFALSTKYRIKPRNPLHEEQQREEQKELEEERDRERERLEIEQQQLLQQQQQQQLLQQQQQQQHEEEHELEIQQQQNIAKIGPNTPPESGPCSPDAYDPFDPTKSPSVSPESQFLEEDELPSHSTISDKDLTNNESILDRERNKLDKNNLNPADLVKALMNTSQDLSKTKKSDQQQYNNSNNNNNNNNIQAQSIDNDSSITDEQQQQQQTQQQSKTVQVLSNVLLSLGKSQHHIPLISSPPQSSSTSSLKPHQSQGFMGNTKLSQNMSNKTSTGCTNSNNYRHNGGSNDDIINDVDSPYSPCSDDFDDLFDPPPETTSANNRNRNKNLTKSSHKYAKTVEIFDNLFGSTSPVGAGNNRLPLPGLGGFASSSARKQRTKTNKKTSVKVAKIPGVGKIDEEQIKIYDDLPNSAVELQVKDKFLRKLNRQERVVEEVKLVLKPHYTRKHISKDEYKEILRRAVPKICHSRSGEINPTKIHNLIEAYVKKFRQRNKLGIGMHTGQVSTAVKCAAYLKKL